MKKRILLTTVACLASFMCFATEISVNLLPDTGAVSRSRALTAAANLSFEEDVVREHRLGAGAAMADGFKPMLQNGVEMIRAGLTSIAEMESIALTAISDDEEG